MYSKCPSGHLPYTNRCQTFKMTKTFFLSTLLLLSKIALCQLEMPIRLPGEAADSIIIYRVDTLRINGDTAFYVISKFEGETLTHKEEKIVYPENDFYQELSHGKSEQWYKDGSKKIEGQFEFGKKIGLWKYWDKDRNLSQDVDRSDFRHGLRGTPKLFIDGQPVKIRED
jgi:hypothetical protein